MSDMPKTFPLKKLQAHNTEESTWVAVHGKVYDVTAWKEEHPGGRQILLEHSGKDATDVFEESVHPAYAQALMKKYYIGDLADPVETGVSKFRKPPSASAVKEAEPGFLESYGIPLAIMAISVAYLGTRFYFQ